MNTAFATNGKELQIWQAPKVEEIGIMGSPVIASAEVLSGTIS